MTFKLHDHVMALCELPAIGVRAGARGVVIEVYADDSVDVEFEPDAQQNLVIAALRPEQLRPVPSPARLAA